MDTFDEFREGWNPFKKSEIDSDSDSDGKGENWKANSRGAIYHSKLHDNKYVKPLNMTKKHYDAFEIYTRAGYTNINEYLRKKYDKKLVKPNADLDSTINDLLSAFSPENTNKKKIVTWSGVPEEFYSMLKNKGPGSHHYLKGFISTSTSRLTGENYAELHSVKGERHLLKITVNPGAGLSVASFSKNGENEVILRHGVHLEYTGTEETFDSRYKITTFIHNVVADDDFMD